jgi:hypothetical protein
LSLLRDVIVQERPMFSAIVGAFILLSVGILMAHAMDAFRSGSGS